MLVYRKLDDFELKYNREFLKHYVANNNVILIIACIALDILELIILICFSMLSVYQYVFLKTLTDSYLLSSPI